MYLYKKFFEIIFLRVRTAFQKGGSQKGNFQNLNSVDVIVDGTLRKRRLDIGDEKAFPPHGIEIKSYETGKVYATKDILEEIAADAELIKMGWRIEWKFIDCEPLRKALQKANIKILEK